MKLEGARIVRVVRLGLAMLLLVVSFGQVRAQVSANSSEHVIHVKFKELFSPVATGSNRISRFGLKPLDRLNQQNNVSVVRRLFPEAGKFERAHKAFGLHLWYEIRLPNDQPIENIIQQYRSISYFERVDERKEYAVGKYTEVAPMVLGAPTSDPLFSAQWHFKNGIVPGADISLVGAWKSETGNRDVIVAVIDGGIDASHPDLHDAMWINSDEIAGNGIDDDQNGYVDDIHGFNFGDNTPTIYPNKHATHVAGTIGAVTNNGIGVAGIAGGSGSADGVRLMNCVGFGVTNDGGFETAMVYAADNGAVISQNSWGGGSSAIEAAIDYFIARAGMDNTNANFNSNIQTGPMAGGIVIFAAGNSNSDNPAAGYPASLDKVIAVASTDIRDYKSSFSNFGPWVDISAPGGDVFSTVPEYNGSYGTMSGTSMSCPHVSGVAALIVSKFKGTSLNPSFVRTQLLQSCDHVPSTATGTLGAGRLNAARALLPLDITAPAAVTDLGYQSITLNSITLSWTAPGSDGQTGTATKYDVRVSIYPITEENFTTWTKVADNMIPAAVGTTETYIYEGGLNNYPDFYFAVKAIDFFGNTAPISNILHITPPTLPPVEVIGSSLTKNIYAGRIAVAQINVANIAAPGAADLTIRAQAANNYPWLKTDPQTFVVHAGSSLNVPIYLDARGVAVTTSQGTVIMFTNDPLHTYNNVSTVNVTMNVTPAPGLEMDSSNIAFGNTYVLQPKDTFIQVYNKGNLPLHIGTITSTNPNFSATASQSVLAPGMIGALKITITPPDQVQQSGIITILSDDPEKPSVTVNVSGKGVPAPAVTSSVASIDVSLNPGENTTVPTILSNNGDSNFNWRAIISAPGNYTQSETDVFAVGDVTTRAHSPVEMVWITTDPYSGFVYAMGSDNILYLYKPASNVWTALSTSPRTTIRAGTYMDDKIYSFSPGSQNAMVVYGLSTGKWELIPVSFDVSNVTTDGTALYAAVGPALYRWDVSNTWTQLASVSVFNQLGGMVYNKGVIYSHLTSSFTGNGNTAMMKYFVSQNSWQEAAELTGKAKNGAAFDPTERKYYVASATGTQIASYDLETDTWTKKTDPQFSGILALSYTNTIGASGVYVARVSGDFARIETSSSVSWISVAPSTGNLALGAGQNVDVRLDAKTLTGGVYRGYVKFGGVSNSNVNALVPVKLTVTGVPNLVIISGSFLIRPTFINEQYGSYIELRNTGNALLRVTSITSDNPTFTTDIASIDLEPGQRKAVLVNFSPVSVGTQPATLTFTSNDSDQPLMTFSASADGVLPPVIELSPSSLNITAFAGSIVRTDVLVSNTGGSDLEIIAYGTAPSTYWLFGSDGGAIVAPGATRVIQAIVNANLPIGTYTNNFAVTHHYDRFLTTIPVTLTVTSAPGIQADLPLTDFGSIYINEPKTITVDFWNYGDQELIVSAVDASDPSLIVGNYRSNILPRQSLGIPLTFWPTAVGNFNGQITITSNDPDDGVLVFPIKGKGVTRPHAQLDAVSLTAALSSGDVVTKHVMLKNTGGFPMTWSAAAQFNSSQNTWMSVSPASGIIGPGNQTDLTVTLNMQGLSTASFSGNISFTADADNNVVLPVTINATDTSPILQGDYVVNFSGVAEHKTSSKWNIKNTGLTNLIWSFTSIPDDIIPTKAGGTLVPGQSDVITFYLDGLPDAGGYYDNFIVKSNQTSNTSTFSMFVNVTANRAPIFNGIPPGVAIKMQDPPLSISLSEVRDPDGDRVAFATATQFPAIAQASISNNFLIIKPVSVGNTMVAVAARDAYGAQAQMTFNVVVSAGVTVTGLETPPANPVVVAASPNPFDKKITITFEAETSAPASVSMYDSNGSMVWMGESTTGEVTIENAGMAAGLYLIKVTKDGKWYSAVRVVKQ